MLNNEHTRTLARPTFTPTTYASALATLDDARTSAQRERRKIAHNTYLVRNPGVLRSEPTLAVYLHETPIVTFLESGAIELNSGGWQTVTTKRRINRYLPAGVSLFQERGEWILRDVRPEFLPDGIHTDTNGRAGRRYEVPFRDGLTIRPDASLHGAERAE